MLRYQGNFAALVFFRSRGGKLGAFRGARGAGESAGETRTSPYHTRPGSTRGRGRESDAAPIRGLEEAYCVAALA
jgi:hypothetical protein